MTTPSVHDVLKSARRLIRKGWCKRALRIKTSRGTTQHCFVGALIFAQGGDTAESCALTKSILAQNFKMPWDEAVRWNNAPERKKSDVLALLDQAIKETAT